MRCLAFQVAPKLMEGSPYLQAAGFPGSAQDVDDGGYGRNRTALMEATYAGQDDPWLPNFPPYFEGTLLLMI